MKKSRGIAPIIIILIVVGVLAAGGIYYFQNKKIPTSTVGQSTTQSTNITNEQILSLLEPKLPENAEIIKIEKVNFSGSGKNDLAIFYRIPSSPYRPGIQIAVYFKNAEKNNYIRKELFANFSTELETKECLNNKGDKCGTQFLDDAIITDFDKNNLNEIALIFDLGAADRIAKFFGIYKYQDGEFKRFDIPFEKSQPLAVEDVIKIYKDSGFYQTSEEAQKSKEENPGGSIVSDQEITDAINEYLDGTWKFEILNDRINTDVFVNFQNKDTGYCNACGVILAEIKTTWIFSSGKFVVQTREIIPKKI